MSELLTRFKRVEIMEWVFDPANGEAFSRHEFSARLVWKDNCQVLHMLISRDIKITGAHVMHLNGTLEAIRVADIPFVLQDLAATLALEHSSQAIKDAYFRAANVRKFL